MKRKIASLILLGIMFVVCLFGAVAFAEENATDFDNSFVLDDLNNAEILGETFDSANFKDRFPQNPNGSVQLLAFVEWAFSLNYTYQKSYGLYLYIYSPTGVEIKDNVELNKVEIATKYNSSGEPVAWSKFPLKLCSADASNLIYKFKVLDGETCVVDDIFNRVSISTSDRRYDINSVELFYTGQVNAQDFGIGGEWHFSGFAKGLDSSSLEESTLTSEATFSNTLKLDVQSTYYRTWQGVEQADQLTSVYFAVDNSIVQKFDRLYSIQAETYKYLTSPVFCVYDKKYSGLNSLLADYSALYSDLQNQVGKIMTDGNSGRVFYWGIFADEFNILYGGYNTASSNFNQTINSQYQDGVINKLAWLFQVSNSDADSAKQFSVSSTEMQNYMLAYSEQFGKTVRGKYCADLFSDHFYFPDYESAYTYDSSGSRYLPIDISADEKLSLVGSNTKDVSFWYSLFHPEIWSDEKNITPIIAVSYSDVIGKTNAEISEEYFIAANDVSNFVEYLSAHTSETVYLFRFDVSPYRTMAIQNNYGLVGYMAQEYVFLDFDIISLTYEKDNVKTVIPVVSDPIDIISGVEPGTTYQDLSSVWVRVLTLLFTVALILLVTFVVIGFVKYLIRK